MRIAPALLSLLPLAACGSGGADAPTGSGVLGTIATAGRFKFGVVGDTRPANLDDTAQYPTAIITQIWQDVAATHADFAVATGDYQFSTPTGTEAAAQLDLYMTARAQFPGPVFAALGNHECTGYTSSNCGPAGKDGVTNNFREFMARMVTPLGTNVPYYVERFDAADGSYTAKLVMVGANAWTDSQGIWLDDALSQPTTYTFVVRHEASSASTAPGVLPSDKIIARHPITLRIVGHDHTYGHYAPDHEVVCGNGGAPLTSSVNYGYGTVELLADGTVQFTESDYQSLAVIDQFRVHADGSPAP